MKTKILIFSAAVLAVFTTVTHNKIFAILLFGVGIAMIADIIVKLVKNRRESE